MAEATGTTVEQKPIRVELGDGSVVEGANLEEAFKNLQTMKVNASNAILTERQKREQAEQEAQRFKQEAERLKAPKQTNGFNNDHYYKLLNEDPIEAQNYIDRYRFGVENPVEAFNYMRQAVDEVKQQSVGAQFLQQHAEDFPATQEAAKLLRQKTEELIKEGHPFGLRTLNLAYDDLVDSGALKPMEKKKDDATVIPPSLTGAGGATTDITESQAEKMSDAELLAAMKKAGMTVG